MTEVQKHIHTAPYRDSAETRARNWIVANLPQLVPTLHGFIDASRAKARKEETGERLTMFERAFDLELRLPEEMPLCTFWGGWSRVSPLPLGFQIVMGSVFFEDKELLDHDHQARRADHRYLEALDDSNVIVDHCVAQFVKRASEDIPKGTRLAATVERAGSLLSKFTNEAGESHTLLIGTRSEITARLGLRYDAVPRYES